MEQNEVKLINELENKLIVSCQAREGWPMYGTEIMAAFARAAEVGGAAAIRATGADNIRAIKNKTSLPILGINKVFNDDFDVYITPTYESAVDILKENIEIIALDATPRKRPNDETFESIFKKIRKNYPNVLITAEISNIEEAKEVIKLDVDFISTTLSGYTAESESKDTIDLKLIEDIRRITQVPIIAEGKINTPQLAVEALKNGAHTVVVGTAITRPEIITEKFVNKLKGSINYD